MTEKDTTGRSESNLGDAICEAALAVIGKDEK